MTAIVDVLRTQAQRHLDLVLYRFLDDGETVGSSITFGDLDRRAREVGAALQARFAPRDRLLLVVPPGLDGIAGFLGAFYGGMVPVPVFPPADAAALATVRKIAADARVAGAITTSLFADQLGAAGLPAVRIEETTGGGDAWKDPGLGADDLAFLQYTSGSTGDPKGVMVPHSTLLITCQDIDAAFHHDADSVLVSWLPTFHDMGLIYGVLLPMIVGFPCYLMSPVAFLRRPLRWLKAISTYGGTHSAAPNFAYDLCVRKTTAEERASLDLSRWRVASNGAEPIRESTLTEFAAAFAPAGFRFERFCPSYGMAEATLKVTTAQAGTPARIVGVDSAALEEGRVVLDGDSDHRLVGCGRSNIGAEIRIVDPVTRRILDDQVVGEIWVSTPSVAKGYWNRPEETERTFRALTEDGRGPFLRTGDLGFLLDGDLFVAGRLKDLIIVRGRNHYPQDIELTAERAHPAVRPGCGTAFLAGNDERLVLLLEATERAGAEVDPSELLRTVRAAVAREHGITPSDMVLFPPGTLPKTSSGKVRRTASRELFLSGAPGAIAEWHRPQ